MNRRTFIATGAGVGTGLLAGCAATDDGDGGNGSETGERTDERETDGSDDDPDDSTEPNVGTFRFLVSDQPVAIDEFDSLNVSFSAVRIFSGDEAEEDDGDEKEEEAEGDDAEETEEQAEEDQESEEGDGDPENEEKEDEQEGEPEDVETDRDADEPDDQRGFVEFDLDGATVDLTTVIGDKATPILENELEEGTYSTIELQAADVEGVVDGERVGVKIPSERLRIVKPFEVRAGESLSFVFDINVVKKGPRDEYNLLPVIGESGVVGRDVEVEEVERGEEGAESDGNDGEGDEEGTDENDEEETEENDEEEGEEEPEEPSEEEEDDEDGGENDS